ncbi:Zinc finger protein zpr1 [Plakobranchus ocellatus]|uniref:Zinc finger protein zpr1 n=1 Tax=Plakobranchus ocellatus TaxID=259542 RepID=A0AAV4DRS1_9GAST|nr:Zinc finger protein zpr1 [Plakobranchus ocellatus]
MVRSKLAPQRDPQLVVAHFARTRAQDEQLGFFLEDEIGEERRAEGSGDGPHQAANQAVGQDDGEGFNSQNEVLSFPTNCPDCSSPCDTNMKLVNIPFFKEVIIMATTCEKCGHRDNEVKSSGGVEPQGQLITLQMTTPEDMSRDVLKSETAGLRIPELDFEMEPGTLGGKFTTVEGLLEDAKNQLNSNPFTSGDSSLKGVTSKLDVFCHKLEDIIKGKVRGYHFVLDDPAGNSFIQSLCAPEPDPQLEVTRYERNWDQNEELGLNDMKTENYEET